MKCRTVLVALLVFLSASQAESWEISPSAGPSGTLVTLATHPCVDSDPTAFVVGAEGGAFLDDLRKADDGLKGTVGIAAQTFEGSVEIWCGQGVDIPARPHKGSGFSYVPRSATWFVGLEGETLGTFIVEGGTPDTVVGLKREDEDPGSGIVLPIPPIPVDGESLPSVRVDIMIDGGINNNNDNTNSNPNGDGKDIWVAKGRLDLVVMPNSRFPTGFLPMPGVADDLAAVLNDTFGAMGLNVTRDGESLTFTLGAGVDLRRGFVLLQVSAPGGDS